MPREWRSELNETWIRRVAVRKYHNDHARSFNERYKFRFPPMKLDTEPLKPAELCVYAWPGDYQMMYYLDGDPVCPKCIMELLRDPGTYAREMLRDVFYEGAPETCTCCNEDIESAYGDPNAEEDEDGEA